MKKENIVRNLSMTYSRVRSLHFTIQGMMLPWIDRIATGEKREVPVNYSEHLKKALPKIEALLKKDSDNIARGIYPIEVLKPESAFLHFTRLPALFTDAFLSSRRRHQNKTKEFNAEGQDFLDSVPEYYQRNFHFQNSGYLADSSAALYEHQVELLFSGSANAMRRLILPALKSHFKNSDGDGLKFLELGSGTGALTRFIALAFPKAQITCVDLSPQYINRSTKNLSEFKRINYVTGTAENLDFKDESFDAVYSSYLFHELPYEVRCKVIEESLRLLKYSGFFGLVDSIQKDDDPTMNWALEQFPKNFHEPFYTNYVKNSVEDLFNKYLLKSVVTEIGFLSKCVTAVK